MAALLLVGGAACGVAPEPELGSDSLPADPTILVLRVTERQSVPHPWDLGQIPQFSLYGGGRVTIPAGGTGTLRAVREYQLSSSTYRELVENAYTAGLSHPHDYHYQAHTDASLLQIALRTRDGMQVTRIVAAETGGSGDRGQALAFVRALPRTPDSTAEYQPPAIAVLAVGGVASAGAQPWPLIPLERGIRTQDGLCTVHSGGDFREAVRLAQGRQQEDSLWVSAGKAFAVLFRPLLPDERTCADLDES